MTIPRFSISDLMAIVVLVALEVGFSKWLLGGPMMMLGVSSDLIIVGILPMTTILIAHLWPLRTREGRARVRPGLVGFEVFGAAGLLLYTFLTWLIDGLTVQQIVFHRLAIFGPPGHPVFLAAVLLVHLLPELALAMLGARVFGKYRLRIVIERREPSEARPETDAPPRPIGALEGG